MTQRHVFGWQKEIELKTTLEEFLKEELTKTDSRWDSIDFTSPSYTAELKSRRTFDKNGWWVTSQTYSDWLLPATKIDNSCGQSLKRHIIFYYYEGDNSLWYLWKDEVDWSTIHLTVPRFHTHPHYYVSRNLWKQIS